jgi:hypothetical protein
MQVKFEDCSVSVDNLELHSDLCNIPLRSILMLTQELVSLTKLNKTALKQIGFSFKIKSILLKK